MLSYQVTDTEQNIPSFFHVDDDFSADDVQEMYIDAKESIGVRTGELTICIATDAMIDKAYDDCFDQWIDNNC